MNAQFLIDYLCVQVQHYNTYSSSFSDYPPEQNLTHQSFPERPLCRTLDFVLPTFPWTVRLSRPVSFSPRRHVPGLHPSSHPQVWSHRPCTPRYLPSPLHSYDPLPTWSSLWSYLYLSGLTSSLSSSGLFFLIPGPTPLQAPLSPFVCLGSLHKF